MPRGLRSLVGVGVLVALLALPSAATATLAFVRNPFHPVVWVAEDDGSHAHKLVSGTNPHVSPDGKMVALMRGDLGSKRPPELVLAPADRSAPPSVLAKGWRNPFVFAWSPDSRFVAAVLGAELGKQRLVLVDTEDGSQRTVARGFFNGVSFNPRVLTPADAVSSPPLEKPTVSTPYVIAYGMAPTENHPQSSDIYRFDVPSPGAVVVKAPTPVRLTSDHRSLSPVWGPDAIVFVKLLGAKQRKYGPKNELYLMNEKGGQVRRLTHTTVDPLLQGLYPTAWSASGKRLLAEFEGQDTTYAVTVNPRTGAQRPLVEATEQGFLGWALSADGKLVLGSTGGFEPGPGNDVATIPYGGGKPKVLAKNAFEPSWSR